jgi:predicted nuclease of predicted toxin-antitoxin system
MKFKIDENLPIELVEILRGAQHDATSVIQQALRGTDDTTLADVCKSERRILVTLDADFSDIHTYPPEDSPGCIVLRLARHDKRRLIRVFSRIIRLISTEPLEGRLWIVEETRVRVRGKE